MKKFPIFFKKAFSMRGVYLTFGGVINIPPWSDFENLARFSKSDPYVHLGGTLGSFYFSYQGHRTFQVTFHLFVDLSSLSFLQPLVSLFFVPVDSLVSMLSSFHSHPRLAFPCHLLSALLFTFLLVVVLPFALLFTCVSLVVSSISMAKEEMRKMFELRMLVGLLMRRERR